MKTLESKIDEIKALYAKLAEKRLERITFAATAHQLQKERGSEDPRLGKARFGLVLAETAIQELEAALDGLEVSLLRAYLTSDYRLDDEALMAVRP